MISYGPNQMISVCITIPGLFRQEFLLMLTLGLRLPYAYASYGAQFLSALQTCMRKNHFPFVSVVPCPIWPWH